MATTPGLGRQIGRGLRKRCPRCGRGDAFRGYFKMRETCSECGYRFYRESGYWTGAIIINLAVCEAWFLLLFSVTVILTAPDVDWRSLLIVGLMTNALLPVFFYPYSKTLWMAIDLHFHPASADG